MIAVGASTAAVAGTLAEAVDRINNVDTVAGTPAQRFKQHTREDASGAVQAGYVEQGGIQPSVGRQPTRREEPATVVALLGV